MNLSRIIISTCHNPAYNLAFEEYLIECGSPLLFLWQNEPTVVIGRNQNPYRECDLKALKNDNVHLVRRRSGGGAVFHDLGNLNFTLITSKSPDCVEKNFEFIIEVLSLLGIDANVSGRNDIEVNGKKFSGNAFFETDEIFCQHGTLLISSNLKKLSQYLTASKLKLQSKGIKSVRSRVCNLNEINKDLTAEDVIKAFCKNLKLDTLYIGSHEMESIDELKRIIDKYKSTEWVYGESPEYNIYFEKKFVSGIIGAEILVDSGYIKKIRVSSDSISTENLDECSKSLVGESFSLAPIKNKILKVIKDKNLQLDLETLFKENLNA